MGKSKSKGLGIENLINSSLDREGRKEKQKKEKKVRRTFEILESTDLLLEKIKLSLRSKGKKITKNELVDEAVKLLSEKYGISEKN